MRKSGGVLVNKWNEGKEDPLGKMGPFKAMGPCTKRLELRKSMVSQDAVSPLPSN